MRGDAAGDNVTVEEVHECSEFKPFDYRLLDHRRSSLRATGRPKAADDAEEAAPAASCASTSC